MKTFPSPAGLNSWNKEIFMAIPQKKGSPKKKSSPGKISSRDKKSPGEKLSTVRPSGAKDSSFIEWVHDIARQIPLGRVTSYGAIAACLGTRLSARMVGWAMNASHLAESPVPAHRVVNRNGLLTGKHHFDPPEKMQQLLENEGVAVKNDKVVDFSRLFWDPSKEI
jgi:methylated-DNA-protein-cysteine methyltransferase-like protein